MPDRLYLSYWLRGFTEHNMLRHFENALRHFPFSRMRPQALLAVRAVDLAEAPLLEREYAGEIDPRAIIEACRWHSKPDHAFELATFWDLWTLADEEWKLRPAPIGIWCYGPLFPSEYGEQLRFEFGLETLFLPGPELSRPLAPFRHNIRSLLHLVHDMDDALPVDKRLLWSESGGNFAERLQEALSRMEARQAGG